jgi:hypothetical protein
VRVGAAVGSADGEIVGSTDGDIVGPRDGEVVGEQVGSVFAANKNLWQKTNITKMLQCFILERITSSSLQKMQDLKLLDKNEQF